MNLFKKKHLLHVILVLIIIIGLSLRFKPALQNNFAFTYDVGRDMLALQEIVQKHNIPFIGPTTGLSGLFYGPWWYYILLPSFVLSGGNPQGVVIFMALAGIMTVLIGYSLGKKIRSITLGIIYALLIAFSPPMIGLSTQIWNPNIAPLWLISIIFILFEIEKNTDKKIFFQKINSRSLYYFLLGFLLALSIDTEVVYGLLLCLAVGIYFIARILRKSSVKEVAFLVAGFVFILLPKILFEIRNDFLMTRTLLNFAGGGKGDSFSLNIHQTFINRFNFMLDFIGDIFGIHNILLILILVFLTILALRVCWRQISGDEKIILHIGGVIIATYYVGLTFFDQNIWPHYVAGLPVMFICIFGIALHAVLIRTQKRSSTLLVFVLVLISLFLLDPVNLYREVASPTPNNNVAVFKNHVSIIDYIYSEAKGEEFKYITYTPPVHDFTYKYLFEWYGNKKYGYTPTDNNNTLLFLIIEPDFEDKTRQERWLEERRGDGIVKKEKSFPSGAVVQLREYK